MTRAGSLQQHIWCVPYLLARILFGTLVLSRRVHRATPMKTTPIPWYVISFQISRGPKYGARSGASQYAIRTGGEDNKYWILMRSGTVKYVVRNPDFLGNTPPLSGQFSPAVFRNLPKVVGALGC